jgi:3',5'-cyclic AMP phosphodiesterase CpdA
VIRATQEPPLSTPDFTLIQFTDTHILPNEGDRMHGTDTLANLRAAVDLVDARGIRPDAVLLSGDLVDNGDLPSYRRLRAVVDDMRARWGAPVFAAMGNHDSRPALREGLLGEPATAAPYFYSARLRDLRVIFLDSTAPEVHHGFLEAEQLAWLREELRTPAPAGTFVVVHHPPVPSPVTFMTSLMLHNSGALAAALASGSDLLAVVCGHVHEASTASFAGVPCFAGPSTAYTVDPLTTGARFRGLDSPGFSILQLFGRTPVATAVPLPATGRELFTYTLNETQQARMAERLAAAEAGRAIGQPEQ